MLIRSLDRVRVRKRVPARFFRLAGGAEPVREWLRSADFSASDRRRIGEDIRTAEYGWPVGMPVCRSLGGGLWEIRTTLVGRQARVIFCLYGECLVLLHGFIKKSHTTPVRDLRLAASRKRQLEDGDQ